MTVDTCDELVAEWLHELGKLVRDLPVVQRRELLRDLESHIVAERADQPGSGETELLEILERLGDPRDIAAAAFEEAGLGQTEGRSLMAAVLASSEERYSGRAAVVSTSRALPLIKPPAAPPSVTPPGAHPPVLPSAAFKHPSGAQPLVHASGAQPLVQPSGAQALVRSSGAQPVVAQPAASSGVALSPRPEAYAPPPSRPAPVVPPLDDKWRRGPQPPRSGSTRATGSARLPGSAPGVPYGLPPAPPPPTPPSSPTSPWALAAVAGGLLLAVFVLVGCFGMAFMSSSSAPAADYPPEPVATAEFAPAEPADPPSPSDPPPADDPFPQSTITD